jgi:hypothetical protein
MISVHIEIVRSLAIRLLGALSGTDEVTPMVLTWRVLAFDHTEVSWADGHHFPLVFASFFSFCGNRYRVDGFKPNQRLAYSVCVFQSLRQVFQATIDGELVYP